MSEAITAIGLILATTVSSIAAIFAAKSEKNSRPVSNGFAAHVTGALDRIERRIDEHLKDHK
jgi:hypothetical protein